MERRGALENSNLTASIGTDVSGSVSPVSEGQDALEDDLSKRGVFKRDMEKSAKIGGKQMKADRHGIMQFRVKPVCTKCC